MALKTIIQLFEEQVKRTPDKVAIGMKNKIYTYKELNHRSNQIAHRLRQYNIEPDSVIAIMAEREIEIIIGFIGILKAGGAYLPIDPKNPESRIRFMIEDSNCKVLLTFGTLKNELISADMNEINLCDETIFTGFVDNPVNINKPNDLAYLIYTSGSTGEPKGVMIEHKSVVKLVKDTNYVDFNDIKILQTGSLAFDASTFEIWGALLNGGSFYIAESDTLTDTYTLKNVIDKHEINTMFLTTALFNQLLSIDAAVFDTLRQLLFGGEATSEKHVKLLSGKNQNLKVTNVYGPTECTTFAAYYPIDLGKLLDKIPIGKPISNTQIYIMKENKLCDVGEPGEICIGGSGVSRGYLNRVELTHEKFMADPYNHGQKIYRTGDLGCWLSSGDIEFLGRIDDQVKIRGFRIEMVEIENRLREIDGINDAVLIVKTREEDKLLCAYIITNQKLDVTTIKERLRNHLPDYMIPAHIIALEKFPVTKNGKIDKEKLPEPQIIGLEEYKRPRNNKEECIVSVFEEILGAGRVGINDNFFELGGDSIKAIRMISRLREYGYESNVRTIMQGKTVRAIGEALEKIEILEIEQEPVVGEVNLTPIQKQFFEINLKDPDYFNQSFMYESSEALEVAGLNKALSAIVTHHDMLRAKYQEGKQVIRSVDEEQLYALICFDFKDIINKEQLLKLINEKGDEVQASLNLLAGPLLKAVLFKTIEKDFLLICIHHLVIDGISWRIVTEDLNKSYTAAKANREIVFPPKTMSYKNWSKALNRYRENWELKSEIEYWKRIEEKVLLSKLALIGKKGAEGLSHTKILLSEQLTKNLLVQSGRAYHTEINDILLTALLRAVQKVSGNEAVSVYLEGHGREPISEPTVIDRTIGWFTSIFPVAVCGLGKTIKNDIRKIKEVLRRIPNHGIGYGVIKYLGEDVLVGTEPDITFNYLGDFGKESSSHEIKISSIEHGQEVSPYNRFGSPISIDGVITNKELRLVITFDTQKCSLSFINRLKIELERELMKVITHCINLKVPEHTASDYGELVWSDSEFKQIEAEIKEKNYQIKRIYPMTPIQEGMLFHKLRNEESTEYVVQSIYKAERPIAIDVLKDSVWLLVQKHEILRTYIVYKKVKEPRQVLLGDREIEVIYIDMEGYGDSSPEYKKIIDDDVKRGFDFGLDSLLRMKVIRLKNNDYRLIICFHHIIMDGWCLSILINDLAFFFQNITDGASKEELVKNINDVTSFESYVRLMQSKDKESGLLYWQELLEDYGGQAILEGSECPIVAEEESDKVEIDLTQEQSKRLDEIGSEYGVTVNTIIEAAWGILLQKYCCSDDVVFGKVVSGRDSEIEGIENMIGLFINSIPIRVKTTREEKFCELLCSLQEQALMSHEYDYCSLAEIQNRCKFEDDLIYSLLEFENFHVQESDIPNSFILDSLREQTNYPLTLTIYKRELLTIGMIYDAKKYTRTEAIHIVNRFRNILINIISDPEVCVKSIELIGQEEQINILENFNQTETDYLSGSTIVDIFEEEARLYPKNIAVVSNETELTYEKLNIVSNKLAARLRQEGIKPDTFVGIMAERRIETIIGILAILKAGGAYVPLDPKYPNNRIKHMIEDSEMKLILTCQPKMAEAYSNIKCINLADKRNYLEQKENLPKVNTSGDLAYLIYTSGTSGKPKGVMIEHRSVNRLVKNSNYIDFEEISILQTGSLTFDASTFEIWGALLNGGKLCLLEEEVLTNVHLLKKSIFQHNVNTMFLTTILYNQLISMNEELFDNLTYLIIGGEKLSETHVKKLKARNKAIHLINAYGPTETTTFAVTHEIVNENISPIPIGKPISNTKAIILSGDSICGVDMQGELCIGGPGLARGYLNKPDLTAEKFINHPFLKGERIYRTGDLVKWKTDGSIVYLRRLDEQIKLRGFRIELGEIESKLKEIEGVNDAAVIMQENSDDKYLCGYIAGEIELDIDKIKTVLSEDLPDYMIPHYFIQLKSLPITKNGKLNKRSLPKPEILSSQKYEKPRNDTEYIIAEAFKTVLDVDAVGIDDSFFELGGHSLRATRLVNILEAKLGIRIPLREVMNEKTVRKLANNFESYKTDKNFNKIQIAMEEEF